jgi:uncharacterized protein YbjT (DUF2867 family)
MKIIVTGSLGHISKPLAMELIQKGNQVTIITSKSEKQKEIEALGATAAVGSVEDTDFLSTAFEGADAVYCMVPPSFNEQNQVEYYSRVGRSYAKAIQQSGVKCIVYLSSYGAHLDKGTGFILGAHYVERILDKLSDIAITYIRPGYFYYNFFGYVSMIKNAGMMMANHGGEDKILIVSPVDIATAIADEIVTPITGRNILYVASDDRTCDEIATILGTAINKPDLKWITITNEQMQNGMEANGLSPHVAANLVELGEATHSGVLREDYEKNKPAMGSVKLEDFAKDFAKIYNS